MKKRILKLNTTGGSRRESSLDWRKVIIDGGTDAEFMALEKTPRLFVNETWVIHPDSIGMQIWNFVMLLWLLFLIYFIPIQIAFFDLQVDLWYLALEAIFCTDIIIGFILSFKGESNEIIFELKSIALRYMKGWFLLDALMAIPFYTFSSGLRILILLKLLKVLKYGEQWVTALDYNPNIPPAGLRITKLIVSIITFVHLSACLWFLVGMGSSTSGPVSWLNRTWLEEDYLIVEQSFHIQYLVSLYWSFTTLTTIGYGDIVPRTRVEIGYTIVVMVGGALVFSYTTATALALVAEMARGERIYKEKVVAFNEFSKNVKLSKDTEQFIRREMIGIWKHPYATLDWVEIMDSMPEIFKLKIIYQLFSDVIERSDFLESFSNYPEFLKKLIASFQPTQFTKGEYAIRAGEPVEHIFLIRHGVMHKIRDDDFGKEPIRIYESESTCGIEELFLGSTAKHSIQCHEDVDAVMIPAEKILEFTDTNEELLASFEKYAVQQSMNIQVDRVSILPGLGKSRKKLQSVSSMSKEKNRSSSNSNLDQISSSGTSVKEKKIISILSGLHARMDAIIGELDIPVEMVQ